MNVKLMVFLLSFCLSSLSFATPSTEEKPNCNENISSNVMNDSIKNIARSGCCSWHQGVCGCNQMLDRIECCDGTLSPSCTCSGYLTVPSDKKIAEKD